MAAVNVAEFHTLQAKPKRVFTGREAPVQIAIVERLQPMNPARGDLVARDVAWVASVPNGGTRGEREVAHLEAHGARAGTPDLFVYVWATGRAFWLEVKADGGRSSGAQAAFPAAARPNAAVVRGVDEAVAALRAWGAPLRPEAGGTVARAA